MAGPHLRAVQVSEQYADGLATVSQLRVAHNAAHAREYCVREAGSWWGQGLLGVLSKMFPEEEFSSPPNGGAIVTASHLDASRAAHKIVRTTLRQPGLYWGDPEGMRRDSAGLMARLLRDFFGPVPFRTVAVPPALLEWREGLVVRLAQAAYERRQLPARTLEPERLAVLADALEEAACGDQEVLEHLREQEDHWRGCWVLDRLLVIP
jgi:hypothetical protein